MNRKYSIILPVRNGGDYVKACVNSILGQKLNNFNLIILDNCSTDGTLDWVLSLKDDRIVVYPADKPLTIEENWGRITSVPKNEFITLIGHDDLLDPEYLQVMDNLVTKHPNASLYQTHFRYIDKDGKVIRKCKPMDENQTGPEFLAFFLANIIDNMGTGYLMRSTDYDAAGGIPFYPNLLFADFELWINLTRNGYKATAFEECFSFRIHQSTTTRSPDIKFHKAFQQFIHYLHELKSADVFNKAIERYSLQFISFYCKGLSHRLLRTPKSKREGLTVSAFLNDCKILADLLVPNNNFNPQDNFSINLAQKLDSNSVSRGAFLLFKKLYSKPVLS